MSRQACDAADLFEGDQHGGAIEHAFGEIPAFAGLADALGGGLGEGEAGVAARGIERLQRFALHGGLGQIDQHEREAGAFAGEDDGVGGDVAIGDRDLHAGEFRAVELRFDGGGRGRAGAFGDGEGADDGAIDDAGQDFGLLLGGAGGEQGFGEEVERGRERDRGDGAADLFGEDAQFEAAEAEAAVFFRNGDAEPALCGDRFPQIGIE